MHRVNEVFSPIDRTLRETRHPRKLYTFFTVRNTWSGTTAETLVHQAAASLSARRADDEMYFVLPCSVGLNDDMAIPSPPKLRAISTKPLRDESRLRGHL
jgi:hypothetical protein